MTVSHYMIQPAGAMRRFPGMIPDQPGLYALVLDQPEALNRALARHHLRLEHVHLGRRPVLYIGATDDSMRRRLKHHLSDDTCRSTFRMSLGAVLMEELNLRPRNIPGERYFGFDAESEAALSDWVFNHVSVAFRSHPQARDIEARLIARAQPPLNIAARGRTGGAVRMADLRRRLRGLVFNAADLN